MTDNDETAPANKGYYVWAWGSSRNAKELLADHECTPSLVINKQVCQIAGQSCYDQEHAVLLILNAKGQVQQNHMNQPWRSPPSGRALISDKISQIACGYNHCAAVSTNGSLWTWGSRGWSGKLGHGTGDEGHDPKQVEGLKEKTVVQVDCGSGFTVALTQDSSVYTWGRNRETGQGIEDKYGVQLIPQKIDAMDGKSVTQISAGWRHTAVSTSSGEVYTWGNGTFGPLGHGNRDDRLTPTLVEAFRGKEIVHVSCGKDFSAAVTQTGLLYTFGYNDDGQLGIRDKEFRLEPTLVKTLEGLHVRQVSCGSNHTIATTNKGVYNWGSGCYGQLGCGSTESSLVPQKVQKLDGQNVSSVAAFNCLTIALVEPPSKLPSEDVNNKGSADLKFMFEDGEEVFAHSYILCNGSDYFKAMLELRNERVKTGIYFHSKCQQKDLLAPT